MLNIFNKKKNVIFYCILNNDPTWNLTYNIISNSLEYFKNKESQFIEFYGWNLKYKNFKGDINKLLGLELKEIIFACLYNDLNTENASIKLYFSVGSPNMIFLEIHEDINFDFKEFMNMIKDYFDIQYGFVYKAVAGKRMESYLFGQREKTEYLLDISRKSERDFDIWRKNKLTFSVGKIRDIYRINILNALHVNSKTTNGQSLLTTIQSDSSLGTIDKIFDDVYYWVIPNNSLDQVRELFENESFIMK